MMVVLLPKNTTAIIQPQLDQGIIAAFKNHCKTSLLNRLLETELTPDQFVKTVTVKDAIYATHRSSWKKVSTTTIENCGTFI